jgi:predicted amidohydrolase YtcJ
VTAPFRIRARLLDLSAERSPQDATIAVSSGRIRAVTPASGPCDLDLRERGVLLPALIDSHLHLSLGARMLSQLDLSEARSRRAFEHAIAQRHASLPHGQWLVAHGWAEENWGGAMPDRTWLASAGSRPAVCYRMDHHACVVNDAVLAMVDTRTNPPGGHFVRNATGAPSGLLVEAAAWTLVNPIVPQPTPQEKQAALRLAAEHLHRHGVTTVGSMEYVNDVVTAIAPLRDELRLRCLVTLLDRDWPLDTLLAARVEADDQLAVIGFKAFADGTLGSHTARMLEDYADDPGNRGTLIELAQRGLLKAWAKLVASAGLSPSIHAIGDEAVRLALEAAESLPLDAHVRIEHAQTIHPDDVPRFRGRIASMQPLHKADDGRYARRRLGRARMERFFPWRALVEAGAQLAFGSDWPIVSPDPIAGIQAAVTGRTFEGATVCPDQNLTPAEAIAAYTTGAARCLRRPGLSTFNPGAAADFVVLDIDPLDTDWSTQTPSVAMTIAGGQIVYDAG